MNDTASAAPVVTLDGVSQRFVTDGEMWSMPSRRPT